MGYRDSSAGGGAGGAGGGGKFSGFGRETRCRFCRDRVSEIDYKDVGTLQKPVTNQGKLFSKKSSGNCAKHQRQLKFAVKRSRFMALMPYSE
jgi:small subunit ribosomal protein S18